MASPTASGIGDDVKRSAITPQGLAITPQELAITPSTIAWRSFDATISALNAETSALDTATSAIARSYRRYRRGVNGNIGNYGVGITQQMCNRVTNQFPSGICLPGTELLQSSFRMEFSMGSCSRQYRRSLRRHC